MLLLADAVAVLHGLVVLVMLTGALVALRRPGVVWVHAPLSLAILGVNLAGADCPLTTLELWLRARAGAPGYRDGFLGHHVFAPLGLDVAATGTQVAVHVVAIGLNAVGYGLLVRRTVRRGPVPESRTEPQRTPLRLMSRRSAPVPGRRPGAPRWRTPARPAAARRAGPRTSSRTSAPGHR